MSLTFIWTAEFKMADFTLPAMCISQCLHNMLKFLKSLLISIVTV
jgi:hypothetical protein